MTLNRARTAPEGEWSEGSAPSGADAPHALAHTRPARPARPVGDLMIPLHTMMETATDGLILIDDQGVIQSLNPVAAILFGYQPDELVGGNVSLLLAEPHRPKGDGCVGDFLAAAMTRAVAVGHEIRGLRKDGTMVPIDLGIAEVTNDGQRLFLAIARDLTHRRQEENEREERFVAELTRSNAELARFAYVASHDLQEPLRMIGSYLDLLAGRYGDKLDSDAHEFIAFAVDGAARMKRLISDLLNYSRVGSTALSLEAVDVAVLVDKVVGSLGPLLTECGGRVEAGPMPRIVADPGQLSRVFQNLVENAIKYRSDAPPLVRISARQAGRFWRFDVADNGIGIDPRFHQKIFEIFRRLHSRTRYEGTGVGLAVTRLAVERHGGTVWAESNVGGGSLFSFTIPERAA